MINSNDFISIMHYYWVRVETWGLFTLESDVDHLSLSTIPFHSNVNRTLSIIHQWTVYFSNSEEITYVDVIVDCLIKMFKWQTSKQKKKKQNKSDKLRKKPTQQPRE